MFGFLYGGFGNNEARMLNGDGYASPGYYDDGEGYTYLLEEAIKAVNNITGEFNGHAIPENRALERAKWYPKLSKEQAIKLIHYDHGET